MAAVQTFPMGWRKRREIEISACFSSLRDSSVQEGQRRLTLPMIIESTKQKTTFKMMNQARMVFCRGRRDGRKFSPSFQWKRIEQKEPGLTLWIHRFRVSSTTIEAAHLEENGSKRAQEK